MARRRYISTDISLDGAISDLFEQYGAFAALLYTWMIPHAEDDATLHGSPKELIRRIMPERGVKPVQIVAALQGMQELGLITWDAENDVVYFPTASFYKYQSYVKPCNRRSEEQRPTDDVSGECNFSLQTAQNAEENNSSLESAQNGASSSLSPSLSDEDDHAHTSDGQPRGTAEPFNPYLYWERVIGQPVGPKHYQMFEAASRDGMEPEVIAWAIDQTIGAENPTKYIDVVLKDLWQADPPILTMSALRQRERQRKSRASPKAERTLDDIGSRDKPPEPSPPIENQGSAAIALDPNYLAYFAKLNQTAQERRREAG